MVARVWLDSQTFKYTWQSESKEPTCLSLRCSDPEIFLSSFSIEVYGVVARVLCGC